MASDAQAIARAFAPFAAIEEFQNVVALHNKRTPVFLRRNLSYSASRQERADRDQKATSIVHLHLEPLSAPAGYSNSITVVAAVCAVLSGGPDGRDAMVPIAAKIGRVGLRPNTQSQQPSTSTSPGGKSLGVTLSMKVPFAQGILPKDIVVVVLHKRDRCISRVVRHINKAKHRDSTWNQGGREVTCTIKDKHAFQWYPSGTNVLFAAVQPSEEMMLDPPQPANTSSFSPTGGATGSLFSPASQSDGNGNGFPHNTHGLASRRGVMELQPGILETQDPFETEDGDLLPSNFTIKNGAIGDATPMLRYVLTLEGIKPAPKKRKRDNSSGGALSSLYPHPLNVNFCSADGTLKVTTKLMHGYSCPFESCGFKCKGTITAIHHHLLSTHPYYEYFVTNSETQGAEIWIRCKKEYFGVDGAFLPAAGVPPAINKSNKDGKDNSKGNSGNIEDPNNIRNNNDKTNNNDKDKTTNTGTGTDIASGSKNGVATPELIHHPLTPLLRDTARVLPFVYICRKEQRKYRTQDGGKYPIDAIEERIEENAAAVAATAGDGSAIVPAILDAHGSFVWDNADLAPVDPDVEEGTIVSELLNNEREESRGLAGGAHGRPPRGGPSSSRQRTNQSGPSLLSKQASFPVKLPLTDSHGLPKFYHRGKCIAMTEQELEIHGEDSDDDSDTEQYMRYCSTALEENPNLCPEQMDFMLVWNLYTYKHPIQADSQVPAVCIAFAKEHEERLRNPAGAFRRCFAAHVMNLWKFRLLTPTQMHEALVAAAGSGGAGGSGAENLEN